MNPAVALGPLEGLFIALTLAGLAVIGIGWPLWRRAGHTLKTLPPPDRINPDFQLVTFLTSFQIGVLLLTLFSIWLLVGLGIPWLLATWGLSASRGLAAALLLQSLGFQIVGLLLLWRFLRNAAVPFGSLLNPQPWRPLLGRALAAYLAMLPALFLVSALNETILSALGIPFSFQEVIQQFKLLESPIAQGLMVVSIIAVAPVFEETLFRGLLFPWLAKRVGWPAAALASSALFAAIHFHLPSAVPLGVLGLFLCAVQAATGRLIYCVWIHALFNAVNLYALTLVTL